MPERDRDVAFGRLAIERRLVARELVRDCFRATTGSLRDEMVRRGILSAAVADELDRAIDASALDATVKLKPPKVQWSTTGAFPAVDLDALEATVRLPSSGRIPAASGPRTPSGRISPETAPTIRTPSGRLPSPEEAPTIRTPSGTFLDLQVPEVGVGDRTILTVAPTAPDVRARSSSGEIRLASSGRLSALPPDVHADGATAAEGTPRTAAGRTPSESVGGALEPGALIGPYRIVSLLGKGGMGAVYRATHETAGGEFALKVMLFQGEEGFVYAERFRREVETLAKVDRHPGIVRIHSAGSHGADGHVYAVMDLVPGRDLSQVIKDAGRLDPKRALDVCAKLARALQHCHERGIIHRDLKPQNVQIRDDTRDPVLLDFGLARDAEQERMTKTGQMLGTPSYLSPEQADGQWRLQDERTDVYGLGAILYECLTGRPPFEGESLAAILKKVLRDDPVDPAKLVPGLPAGAGAVALRCLAKERHRRYQDVTALAEDLERLMRGERPLARAPSALETLSDRVRRHRTVVAGIAMALASVVAAGLYQNHVKQLDDAARQVVESAWRRFSEVVEKHRGGALEPRTPDPTLLAELATARAQLEEVRAGADVTLVRSAIEAFEAAVDLRTRRVKRERLAEVVAQLEAVTAGRAVDPRLDALLAEDRAVLWRRLGEPGRAEPLLAALAGPAAREARARCLLDVGEPGAAAAALDGLDRARALRALALARAGERVAALEALGSVAASTAEGHLARGAALAAIGSPALAVLAARAAERELALGRRSDPVPEASLLVGIAGLLLSAGRAEEAVPAFERALATCEELVRADEALTPRGVTLVTELVPGVVLRHEALEGLAEAHLLSGEPERARDALDELLRSSSPGESGHACALARQARLARLLGDDRAAAELARRAAATRPGDVRLRLELALQGTPAEPSWLEPALALGGRAARRAAARSLVDALGSADAATWIARLRALSPTAAEEAALAAAANAPAERGRAIVAAAFDLGGDARRLLKGAALQDALARWQERWFWHFYAYWTIDATLDKLIEIASHVGLTAGILDALRRRADGLLAMSRRANPWDGEADLEAAKQGLRDGARREEVLAALERARERLGSSPELDALLAWTLAAVDPVEPAAAPRAAELATGALAARRDSALASAAAGLARLSLGDPGCAADLERALALDRRSGELRADWRDRLVWQGLALARERAGHGEAAARAREQAAARDPGTRRLVAHALFREADVLDGAISGEVMEGGLEGDNRVIELAARALELDPNQAYARYLVVKRSFTGGIPPDEESAFWHIARFCADEPSMHDKLDKLMGGARIVIADQVTRLSADPAHPGNGRALALARTMDALVVNPDTGARQMRKTDAAIAALEEVLADDPLHPLPLLERALLRALAPIDAKADARLRKLYDQLAQEDVARVERHVPRTRTTFLISIVLRLHAGGSRSALLHDLGLLWPETEPTCRLVTDLADRDPMLKDLVAELLAGRARPR